MSWIDKIKKVFVNENDTKTASISRAEVISLHELDRKLDARNSANIEKSKQLNIELTSTVNYFSDNILTLTSDLEYIDLTKRKEHEKIKAVVLENLSLYTAQVKRFVQALKNTQNLDFQERAEKISLTINDFVKTSNLSFEKSTILIGAELEKVKNRIKQFFREFSQIIERNREFIASLSSTRELSSKMKEYNENVNNLTEIERKLEILRHQLKEKHNDTSSLNEQKEEIKASMEHKKDLHLKEEHKQKLLNLESELQSIKERINFKALARVFHTDVKKITLIKEYSNNFKNTLIKDENLDIIDFISQAQKVDMPEIKFLKDKIILLGYRIITRTDEELGLLEHKISSNQKEISSLNEEIDSELKKKERLTQKDNKIVLEMKVKAKTIFPDLEIK